MADKHKEGDSDDNVMSSMELAPPLEESDGYSLDNPLIDLRGDPRTRPVLPATEFSGNHKKKSTSFQITSVTVQGSRLGNDAGEDSADDLDESHTEDMSSDVLDCSKTTDLENDPLSSDNSNANLEDFALAGFLPGKQSLPPKSVKVNETVNFGVNPLSISSSSSFSEVTNSGVAILTSTTASPTVVNAQVSNALPENWQRRFKVVKIVSSEPFKRGRWICMDFTDPPPSQNSNSEPKPEAAESVSNETVASLLPGEGLPVVTHVYEFPSNSCPVVVTANQPLVQPVYGILVPSTVNSVPSVVPSTTGVINVVDNLPPVVSTSEVPTSEILSNQPPQSNQNQPAVPNLVQNSSAAAMQTQAPSVTLQQQQQVVVTSLQSNTVISAPAVTNPAPQPSVVQATAPSLAPSNLSLPTNGTTVHGNQNIPALSNQPSAKSLLEGSGVTPSQGTAQQGTPELLSTTLKTPFNNQSPLSDVLPDALGTKGLQEGEESESAPAGTSTVAIDNKIEQAMDLVKSHLMFAVREEVDVLKEKITELMDRISQLEVENGILKANASQETLSQLPAVPTGTQVPTQLPSNPTMVPLNHLQPQQHVHSQPTQTSTT